jgi:hypothetical protein
MSDAGARLAVADCFVRHDERADAGDKRKRGKGRDRDRGGDEGEQQNRADRPPTEDSAGRSPEERDVREQVERCAGAESDCDAMFLDNEMAGLLGEQPLRTSLDFDTRIFSRNTSDRFLEYLDEIREAVRDEHVALVQTVYGPDWDTPYTTLYERAHGRGEGGEEAQPASEA